MSLDEALGRYAEALQDLSSAGLAAAAGNFYNCADICNQATEKLLQAVYVLRHDSPAAYDHDLPALGAAVGAPPELADDLAILDRYHPAKYLEGKTPDEADDEVGPDTAQDLIQRARRVQRWARPIIFSAE